MFGLLLAFVVEAGWMLWFRFHVGFHVLLWKTLLARFAVAWRHRGVEISEIVWCWFCVEMVASLRCLHSLWFTRVLFISAGLEARFQRAVLPALASEEELQARFKRCSSHVQESQERVSARQARCFKLSGFRHRPQAAGPIRASVRGGAPPARLVFARHFHVTKNNLFLPLY